MQEDTERLKTALRVLEAVAEFRKPEDADVEKLQSYAPLLTRPDDLACEVIQQVLKAQGRISDDMAEKVKEHLGNV